jgi:DNA-binding transcriptional regulator PaaX
MRFTRINSVSYYILYSLAETAGGLAQILANPPTSISTAMYQLDKHYSYPYYKTKKGIDQLEDRELITKRKSDHDTFLKLTQKGKLEIVRIAVREKRKLQWDGKWRMVIFDIPETSRKDRDFLRSQLLWMGFLELQKSVWIIPYDTQEELRAFLTLCTLELQGDVRFLLVESIESDADLKRSFSLK